MKVSGQSSGTCIELEPVDVNAWFNIFYAARQAGEGIRITIDAEGEVLINGCHPDLWQKVYSVIAAHPKDYDKLSLIDAVMKALQ